MYICTRFQSIWTTSDFEIKFAPQKNLGWSIWTNACNLRIIYFNPIQDGLFWGCSRMGVGLFGPPSLKLATYILQ